MFFYIQKSYFNEESGDFTVGLSQNRKYRKKNKKKKSTDRKCICGKLTRNRVLKNITLKDTLANNEMRISNYPYIQSDK